MIIMSATLVPKAGDTLVTRKWATALLKVDDLYVSFLVQNQLLTAPLSALRATDPADEYGTAVFTTEPMHTKLSWQGTYSLRGLGRLVRRTQAVSRRQATQFIMSQIGIEDLKKGSRSEMARSVNAAKQALAEAAGKPAYSPSMLTVSPY